MIAVVAVVDLRSSAMMASYGLSSIFFYSAALLFFLIPIGFVCAELATTVHEPGGMYVWIRTAFGDKTGFVAIWLEWINNLIAFPASLSFICVTLLYLVDPKLAHHKTLILWMTLATLWLMTGFTLLGIRASSRLNRLGGLLGNHFTGNYNCAVSMRVDIHGQACPDHNGLAASLAGFKKQQSRVFSLLSF